MEIMLSVTQVQHQSTDPVLQSTGSVTIPTEMLEEIRQLRLRVARVLLQAELASRELAA